MPIFDSSRNPVGVLAAVDPRPRNFPTGIGTSLDSLAALGASALETAAHTERLARVERELEHARDRLTKSENFYHSLVETLPQYIIRKDLAGRFTFANQKFCALLGRSLQDIVGRTDHDFYPPELADKFRRDDRRIVETARRLDTVEENRAADSDPTFVQVVKTPILDEHGMVVGIQGVFWDVTEIRRTEMELEFEQQLLRELLNSIPDHVYFKDRDSRFIRCSRELSDQLGLDSPDEAKGKTDFDFFTREHAQKAYNDEQRILRTGKPIISSVERETMPSGEMHWMLTTKMPLRIGDDIIGTFGVSRDISKLIAVEHELKEARMKYQEIFEKAVEGIFQTTPDGRYLEANPALARIYGYDSAQELLQSITNIERQLYVDQRRRQEFQKRMEEEGEVHEFESEIYRRDGEKIWISESARSVRNHSGQILYYEGIAENISERKRAEAALEKARQTALEATRLKSIFLANMSHEIRTPLNGILAMAGLLRRTPLNEKQTHFATTIEESGIALLRLINNILDFSKMESGKMTLESADFDPSALIDSVSELLAESAERKGLEFIVDVDPNIPSLVSGDATRLRQILNNLAGNAIKFTNEGEIRIHVESRKSRSDKCRLRFEVQDTGIGIDPSVRRKIFQSFTQADQSTNRRFGGTGLGLTISRQLVDLMGGRLQVRSEPGKGSRFWFTLNFESCQNLPDPVAVPDPQLEGKCALIAVVNPAVGRFIRSCLEKHHVSTVMVHSVARARKHLGEGKTRKINYLIVAQNLSGNRGLKFCEEVKANGPDKAMRKILLAPLGKYTPASRLEQCGIDYVITRPISRSRILSSLKDKAVAKKTAARPQSTRPSLKKHQILVVEDNRVNQSVAHHILQQLGYEGTTAENGMEAIARLQQNYYPIILMDCQMPELDGYETTRRIREMEVSQPNRKRSHIIAMTANAMEGDRQKCLESGMDDYISKPLILPRLEAALSQGAPSREEELLGSNETLSRFNSDILDNFQESGALEQLVELYSRELPIQLGKMENAASASQLADLVHLTHTAKGSANNMGAIRLASLFEQLEHVLNQETPESQQVRTALDAVQKEAKDVLAELHGL